MSAKEDLEELARFCEEIGHHGRVTLGSTQYMTTERGKFVASMILTLSTSLLEERSTKAWERELFARVESGLRDDVQRLTDALVGKELASE